MSNGRIYNNSMGPASPWKPTPVDKDYVAWLDKKALSREENQNGKGDDVRPYGKQAFDRGYENINWAR